MIQDSVYEPNGENVDLIVKSLSLRIIVGLVADVHQPFRTIQLFSEKFPDGD